MTPAGNMTSKSQTTGSEGLVAQLVARAKLQPAKTAITSALLLVLAVLVVRLCVRPKAAGAALVASGAAVAVPASPAPSSAAGGAAASAAGSPRIATTGEPLPDWRAMQVPVAMPRVLTRDMFAIDLRRYARARANGQAEPLAVEAKSPNPAETQTEAFKRQAAGFRLQGTVTGPLSAAFLDGTCVHVGDEYRGFRIVAIAEQSVVLECEGVRLELRMPER